MIMKKVLLIVLSISFAMAVMAQTTTKLQPVSTKLDRSAMIAPEKDAPYPHSFDQPSAYQKTVAGRDLTFIPIGAAGNAYGFYGDPRTYLWADPRINSIAFVHRMLVEEGTYGNSRISYDVSWEGGENGTWTNNIQVYEPLGPGTPYPDAAGRYPQGGIFNPPGNTDPDNAYFTYYIPTLDNSNTCGGNNWGGFGYGVNNLTTVNPPAPTQHNTTSGGDYWNLIPTAFTITQDGHVWMVDGNYPCDANAFTYDGNIHISHGVWDPDEADLVFEDDLLPALEYADGINDMKIAFAPDGQTGYICIMSDVASDPQASNGYHPILLKTTDGGESWGDPVHVLMGGYDGIDAIKEYWSDEALLSTDQYSGGFDRDTVWYNLGYHCDMAIDDAGNPHITGLVAIASPDGWYPYDGTSATFHIYSMDGGESFEATGLYDNKTFEGAFGAIAEWNRPQISSTLDGRYFFISCIDTDFEGIEDNTQPDIFCAAYNKITGEYTEMTNITQFTQAWLQAWEGSQSHYVFVEDLGTDIEVTVPFVYEELEPAVPENPAYFWYIDGWTYTFTKPVGFSEPASTITNVSQNYPNPFGETSEIHVELATDATLGIEIFNLMGQKVYSQDLGNVNAGQHRFVIDAAGMHSGVYFYNVKAGDEVVTRKMIIE
jgi:hypothetical protein